MGFSEKRGDSLNVVNSPFNRVTKAAEHCRSGNSKRLSISSGCRSLVAGTAGGVVAVAESVRPQLTRRAEAVKTVQQQALPARKWKMRWKSV